MSQRAVKLSAERALMNVSVTAPRLLFAYYIGKGVLKDVRNGSSRNTVKRIIVSIAVRAGMKAGMFSGMAIGDGISSDAALIGGLIGWVSYGIGAYFISNIVTEVVFEIVGYDVDVIQCQHCCKEFRVRRYKNGPANMSHPVCSKCQKSKFFRSSLFSKRCC